MNDSIQSSENEANAQAYYPKAITLGKTFNSQTMQDTAQADQFQQSAPQQGNSAHLSSQTNPLFSLFGKNLDLSQLFGGNPLLASLLTGNKNFNQTELLNGLMNSFSQKSPAKEEAEKIIDIENPVEEL